MRTWVSLAALGASLAVFLAHPRSAFADNLALHKTYTFSAPPDYPGCTDSGDATQLTDGRFTSGRLWTDIGAVGWTSNLPKVVTVKIDLGAVAAIDGASFSTAAAQDSGVRWPLALDIFASDDGRAWSYLGDLRALDKAPPQEAEQFVRHKFEAHGWHGRGRYVSVVISYDRFAFADEIEVFPDRSVGSSWATPAVKNPEDFVRHTKHLYKVVAPLAGSPAEHSSAPSAQPANLRPTASDTLHEIAASTSSAPASEALETKAFAVRAAGLAKGGSPLVAWKKNKYDPVGEGETPNGNAAVLDIETPRMAWRADSFILTNTSTRPVAVALRTEGLASARAKLVFRKVPFTSTALGTTVASALLPLEVLNGVDSVTIPAGMNQELWLVSLPANATPGAYEGRITVTGPGISFAIRARLKISPILLPDHLGLHLGGFDYTDSTSGYDITPQNRDALVSYLQQRFVDVTWGRAASVVPAESDFAADDKMKHEFDWSRFDSWVRRWPYARRFYVYLRVGDSFAGAASSTTSFRRRVASWASTWSAHIRAMGWNPTHFGVLLVDEPAAPSQAEKITLWSATIRAANSGLLIYEDPNYPALMSPAAQAVIRASDIVSPPARIYLRIPPGERDALTASMARRALWLYAAEGPVTTLDPYAYHRLMAWLALDAGAQGVQFWSFADAGGAGSWNEPLAKGRNYAPEYIGKEISDSKHMFAIVEGVEDHEILAILAGRVERHGGSTAVEREARTLVQSAPEQVLDRLRRAPDVEIRWDVQKDRGLADRVVHDAMRLIEALDRNDAATTPRER